MDMASWERLWKMSENPLVLKLWSNALNFHMSLVCMSQSVFLHVNSIYCKILIVVRVAHGLEFDDQACISQCWQVLWF
jgi:hypothetical protein